MNFNFETKINKKKHPLLINSYFFYFFSKYLCDLFFFMCQKGNLSNKAGGLLYLRLNKKELFLRAPFFKIFITIYLKTSIIFLVHLHHYY